MSMHRGFSGLTALLALVLGIGFTGLAQAQPTFTYDKGDKSVVVRYTRTPGELQASDPTTEVTVYGSGRVVVKLPSSSPRKGRHETRLSEVEMNALVADLVGSEVMEFDLQALAATPGSATQSVNPGAIVALTPLAYYVADADVSTMTINLAEYTPPGKPTRKAVVKDFTVSDLQSLQRQHPGDAALAGLARAERQLIGLSDSDSLTSVP